MSKRYKISRNILIFWTLFIGIGAFVGGISMLLKPDGSILHMDEMLPYFQVLPFADVLFQDYLFSGIALIIVNGITNIIASIFLFTNKKLGLLLGTIFGVTLMAWIIIQFVIFPANVLSTIYFIFGFLQFITGLSSLVFYTQDLYIPYTDFIREESSQTLVVYFSRMGYTKTIAYQKAEVEKANLLELKTNEHTENTSGFWWCGRYAMHAWKMPISNDVQLSSYKKVIIVSPIWCFKMAAPIRDFVATYQKELKDKTVEVCFNHFNPWLPKMAIKEMNSYVNVSRYESYQTQYGKTRKKNLNK